MFLRTTQRLNPPLHSRVTRLLASGVLTQDSGMFVSSIDIDSHPSLGVASQPSCHPLFAGDDRAKNICAMISAGANLDMFDELELDAVRLAIKAAEEEQQRRDEEARRLEAERVVAAEAAAGAGLGGTGTLPGGSGDGYSGYGPYGFITYPIGQSSGPTPNRIYSASQPHGLHFVHHRGVMYWDWPRDVDRIFGDNSDYTLHVHGFTYRTRRLRSTICSERSLSPREAREFIRDNVGKNFIPW